MCVFLAWCIYNLHISVHMLTGLLCTSMALSTQSHLTTCYACCYAYYKIFDLTGRVISVEEIASKVHRSVGIFIRNPNLCVRNPIYATTTINHHFLLHVIPKHLDLYYAQLHEPCVRFGLVWFWLFNDTWSQ